MSITDVANRDIAQLEDMLRDAQARGDDAVIRFATQALSDARALRDNPAMAMINSLFSEPQS